MMKSRQDVDKAAAGFRYEAGKYRCPKLIDYEYRASYYGYPINYLWCTNNTWVYGFELMAQRSQYFVMDLSAEEARMA